MSASTQETALHFECAGETLIGILHRGDAQPARRVGILVVVGGPQYRVGSHRQFLVMARRLAAAGYPVLRFDYRGMGDSSGESRTFVAVSDDIKAAIDAFIAAEPSLDGIVIFGLCDAASAASMYCSADARVRGVILANPWVRTEAGADRAIVRHYYGRRFLQRSFWSKLFSGQLEILSAARELFRRIRSARGRGQEVTRIDSGNFLARMQRGLDGFSGPILLLMSDRDLTAREFDDLCGSAPDWSRCMTRSAVERYDVRNADHTFSSRQALNDVCERSISWLRKLG